MLLRLSLLASVLITLAACDKSPVHIQVNAAENEKMIIGNGKPGHEVRPLSNAIKQLEISGAYQLTVKCDLPNQIELSGEANLLPLVSTKTQGTLLEVAQTRAFSAHQPIQVLVKTCGLSKLDSTGTNEVTLQTKTDKLTLAISGAGEIKASGEAKQLSIEMNGAGSLDTTAIKADDVKIEMSGAGDASVHVKNSLNVDISGVGNVRYHGNPNKVTQTISGMGTLEKAK